MNRRRFCFSKPLANLLLGLLCLGLESNTLPADEFETESRSGDDHHDVLLLIPSGPIYFRIVITDGGKTLEVLRREYTQRLVAQLDTDKDGRLGRHETTKHPLFVSGRRFTGNTFLETLREKKPYTDEEIRLAVDRAAGQPIAFRQNEALVDQDLNVFRVLDADQSGLLERAEMRTAAERIAARDMDFDQCITFDEFLDQPGQADQLSIVQALNSEPPPSIYSELMRNAAEPIMAARLVRIYDRDKDAHLSATELGWSQERCAELDSTGDGKLSVQELAGIRMGRPDLLLAIDFENSAGGGMELLESRDPLNVVREHNDVVSVNVRGLSISIGYRRRDPLAESEENARNAFNAIDVDANGYLDRTEIVDHQRFERYLFDAMDSDGDGRVFANEMLSYVNAYTEPATTSCQVTLFDMGNGYFQTLDRNADGRISIRELRSAENFLLAVRNDSGKINPSRAPKSYRIEFTRGGVSLFGRVDRPDAESPAALLKPPNGPIWFQRMDRNSDGDLTWDEFLGPRGVFHQLDVDQDGLIDAQEAAKANAP